MAELHKESNSKDMLWVLTRLKNSTYAIDSTHIEAIFQLEEDITAMAESDHVNRGIISFRGSVLPVIELRALMGMESFSDEEMAFEEMLEQRKRDHINWVAELKRCATCGDEFTLATDPHKCAFGKWYDNYKPISTTVAFHLKQIDEPHKKLHDSAVQTLACKRDCEKCTRAECLQISLKRGADLYMPQVVQLLDEAKQVFRNSYRRMVVVITMGKTKCGLIVDEVLSVENLIHMVPNSQFGALKGTRSVTHIAMKKNDPDLILVLNLETVLEQCSDALE